jgi:hypothetical protein
MISQAAKNFVVFLANPKPMVPLIEPNKDSLVHCKHFLIYVFPKKILTPKYQLNICNQNYETTEVILWRRFPVRSTKMIP